MTPPGRHIAIAAAMALAAAALFDFYALDALRTGPGWPGALAALLAPLGSGRMLTGLALVVTGLAGWGAVTAGTAQRRRLAGAFLSIGVAGLAGLLACRLVIAILGAAQDLARPEATGGWTLSAAAAQLAALLLLAGWALDRRRALWVWLFAVLVLAMALAGTHTLTALVLSAFVGAGLMALIIAGLVRKGVIAPLSGTDTCALAAAAGSMIGAAGRHLALRMPAQAGHDPALRRLTAVTLTLVAIFLILFLAAPGLDIAVSRWFWDPEIGFWPAASARLLRLREIYYTGIEIVAFGSLAMLAFSLRAPGLVQIPRRVWGFAASAFLLGPGLIANLILKDNWGRARPANIQAFGGEAQYTLPFQLADQCERNCSFVSGEGSGIAMVALVVVALFWPVLRRRKLWSLATIITLAGIGIALRVMMGRHFLSDSIFAILLMALLAIYLYRLFDIGGQRQMVSLRALGHDLAAVPGYLAGRPGPVPSLIGDGYTILRAAARIGYEAEIMLAALIPGGGAAPRRDPADHRNRSADV